MPGEGAWQVEHDHYKGIAGSGVKKGSGKINGRYSTNLDAYLWGRISPEGLG
jgi:hypothetical protein